VRFCLSFLSDNLASSRADLCSAIDWLAQIPETVNDAYFSKAKAAKSADKEGEFFQEKKGGEGLSAERKEEQKVSPHLQTFLQAILTKQRADRLTFVPPPPSPLTPPSSPPSRRPRTSPSTSRAPSPSPRVTDPTRWSSKSSVADDSKGPLERERRWL
jgi:hypothetical protein